MRVITQVITWLPRLRRSRRGTGRSNGRTSASGSTTWRGAQTASASDPDPTDDALSDLVREAQEEVDGSGFGEERGDRDQGEVIEGAYAVTFILIAPGHGEREFEVRVSKDSLRVEADGLELIRRLRCRVDPSSLEHTYRNGVLSVRLAKAF
jgi:HSP20 family molecular chaperone IbpA